MLIVINIDKFHNGLCKFCNIRRLNIFFRFPDGCRNLDLDRINVPFVFGSVCFGYVATCNDNNLSVSIQRLEIQNGGINL